ncbi:MAG: (2Fe-2S) ferredoxin domain-containing protein [Acidocella sp.]|nr:(2Fe-2S) ferredoxin domain-containing protein [Acidocella sp.]
MGHRLATDPAPFFETHIFVCGNRRPDGHERGCCASKGSEKIRDYMKVRAKELGIKNIRVNQAGCLDRCELGPCAVLYPEGVWYRLDSFAAVDDVLAQHVMQGERVLTLMLPERA